MPPDSADAYRQQRPGHAPAAHRTRPARQPAARTPKASASATSYWSEDGHYLPRFQGCSSKNTDYRFDERHHLIAVTGALNQTTTLERKPDGEVLRIQHPDGSAESFTYNALGQVLTHTDGKGQTTRLPSSRQDAKGQCIRYEYDQAIRRTAPVNDIRD